MKIAWLSDGLNQIVHRSGHVCCVKRDARRNPGPAAQTAWVAHIQGEVSVLAVTIVGKEFKKIGISADGEVVKVSALQGALTCRNNSCPCDCMKV